MTSFLCVGFHWQDVAVTLIEGREILSSFDASLRDWAKRRLGSEGIRLVTGECTFTATVRRLVPRQIVKL